MPMPDTMELKSSWGVKAGQMQELQEDGAAKGMAMADEPCGADMGKARANEVGMVLLAEVGIVLPAKVSLVLLALVNAMDRASAE